LTVEPAPDKSPARIAGMFDAIAPRYDLLNHLLSAGIDRRWRAAAIRSLQLTGRETLLDICCGTADVALEARRARPAAACVVGVDFSGAMLALGLRKVLAAGESGRVTLLRAQKIAQERALDPRLWPSIQAVAPNVPRWRYDETLGYVSRVFANLASMDARGKVSDP